MDIDTGAKLETIDSWNLLEKGQVNMKLQKRKKKRKKEKKFLAIVDVANKIMPHQHQRCLYPNAQRYEYDSLHSKRVIKVADKIKVANNLTLRLEDYSELSRWAQCNHKGI